MPTIDVLLATYNGATFLPDQLASLAAQSFTDWRVIVRDDGSSDGSLGIVERWAEQGGHDLIVLDDGRRNLGAKDNFAALIAASDAPYFACCDQDDVWLPDKLATMLAALRAAEAREGPERPLLAYSDLQVVDDRLREIHPSFRAYASIQHPRPGREVIDLMTQNVVTGCASLGNAALRRAALPIPREAVMHDWWLALIVAAAGELVRVDPATIRYRQHGANASLPIDWSISKLMAVVRRDPVASWHRAFAFAVESQAQAAALAAHLNFEVDLDALRPAVIYGALRDRSFFSRKLYALSHPPAGSALRKFIVGLCL